MRVDKISSRERISEGRRERALLRAPVTPPSRFSKKAIRNFALEAREEFRLRGA